MGDRQVFGRATLRRQAGAALGSPGPNDTATVLGGHAGTKTVCAFALEDAGLESALHEYIRSLTIGSVRRGAD